MVGTFRLITSAKNPSHIKAWVHGAPDMVSSPHLMVPFWYPALVVWREWSNTGSITNVRIRIHGPQPTPYVYAQKTPVELIGLAIAPELSPNLLGVSSGELAGQFADSSLEGLGGPLRAAAHGESADAVAAQLSLAMKGREITPIDRSIDGALMTVRRSYGSIRMRDIITELGVNERQFRRRFKECVGTSAKQYSRLLRVNALVAAADKSKIPDWADLALRFGYFDQAHMINDLKSLTGLAPTSLDLGRRSETRAPW